MSKDQSFAKAFDELEKITHLFEQGKFDLDEGLKQFERGLELATVLKKKLTDVENKVDVIKKKFASLADNAPARHAAQGAAGGERADNAERNGSGELPF